MFTLVATVLSTVSRNLLRFVIATVVIQKSSINLFGRSLLSNTDIYFLWQYLQQLSMSIKKYETACNIISCNTLYVNEFFSTCKWHNKHIIVTNYFSDLRSNDQCVTNRIHLLQISFSLIRCLALNQCSATTASRFGASPW